MDILPQLYFLKLGRQTKQGFVETKQLKVDELDNKKKYGDKSFAYTLDSFTFHKGRRHYAYIDSVTGTTLISHKIESDVTPEDSDTRDARDLVRTAIQNATSNYGLAMVILAACAGLGGGLFIGVAVGPMITGAKMLLLGMP